MLQFFKSDAVRKTVDGEFNPEGQKHDTHETTHPGGGESYQSETRYRAEGTGISGDFVNADYTRCGDTPTWTRP